jgi:hypothetical protein
LGNHSNNACRASEDESGDEREEREGDEERRGGGGAVRETRALTAAVTAGVRMRAGAASEESTGAGR